VHLPKWAQGAGKFGTMSAAPPTPRGEVLWSPSDGGPLGAFLAFVRARTGRAFADYPSLHAWSVADLEGFWSLFAEWAEISWVDPPSAVIADRTAPMWNTRWWPDARLNYVDQLRTMGRCHEAETAVVGVSQSRGRSALSWGDLFARVVERQRELRDCGVTAGDRVVAYLPNVPEALVVFLATASLGAVFSSCPPEFGVSAVVGRFAQITPKVLYFADSYCYGIKRVDLRSSVAEITAGLPSLVATVRIDVERALPAVEPISADELVTTPVDARHPLYVLYSSGTTGQPKGIVHGHAGTVHEVMKMMRLHHGLGRGDRFMWYTTTGWMMWNYLVGALLVGATIVLFDGDPSYPDMMSLWNTAAEERLTMLGLGAPFLHACDKAGLSPRATRDLSHLRIVGSTGSPLLATGYRWVHEHVGAHIAVHSISGGTDLCTAFLGMSPMLAVRAGEMSCAALAADVQAWRDDGTRCEAGETGELVIATVMPTMPVALWNDPDRSRLRSTYFEHFAGVWRHGDWVTFFSDGACIVGGRSDATLNRGGVRVGTSEFYGVVESLSFVVDSLIVHLTTADDPEGRLILFVQTRDNLLDESRTSEIGRTLRTRLSPRHVPDHVFGVRKVPRTLSGKKLEIPVKKILGGQAIDDVCSRASLNDPTALDEYVELRTRI